MSGNSLYCQHCDRTLNTKNDFDQHCKGRKHLENERLASEREAANCKVFVSDIYGVQQNFLWSYFSRFGALKRVIMHGKHSSNSATVEFKDSEAAARVLRNRNHRHEGVRLNVKKYRYRPPKWELKRMIQQQHDQEEKDKLIQTQHEMMDVLMPAENLTEQMNLVAEQLKLDPEDRRIRAQICDELTRIFAVYFESCSVHQFGSSVNGYGAKGCDLDLFLDLRRDQTLDAMGKPKVKIQLPYHKDIKSLKIDFGPLSEEQLEEVTLYDRVKLVARILTSQSSKYTGTMTIPSARCPVVKFAHEPSGLKCDLSLNNRKALHNSHLLRLYGTDPRVHKLVSTVRLWARAQEFSGGGGTSTQFSSYALTLIVMFYLMHKQPKIIPLVDEVVECVEGAKKEMIDEWECVAVPHDAVLPPSENTETEVELLKGFFEFYTKSVDWERDVLVTKDASVIPRSVLSQDPAYIRCKAGCMTVLDPFVLNHNVVAGINEKTRIKFVAEVKRAAELMSDWPNCDVGSGSQPWGIAALLIPGPPEPKPGEKPPGGTAAKSKGKGQDQKDASVGKGDGQSSKHTANRVEGEQENGDFCIALQPSSATMSCEQLLSSAQQNNMLPAQQWCVLAQEMVISVLKTVYMVHVEDVKVDEDARDGNLNQGSGAMDVSKVEEKSVGNNEKDLSDEGESEERAEKCKDTDENKNNKSLMEEDMDDVSSSKRTLEEASLDGSGSESMDMSSEGGGTIPVTGKQNPKKRFCEGVSGSLNPSPETVSAGNGINVSTIASGAKNEDISIISDADSDIGQHKGDDIIEASDIGEEEKECKRGEKDFEDILENISDMKTDSEAVFGSPAASISPISSSDMLKSSGSGAAEERESRKSSYFCSCRHQVWLGRKKMRARMAGDTHLTSLAMEQEVSRLILKEMEKLKASGGDQVGGQGQSGGQQSKGRREGEGHSGGLQGGGHPSKGGQSFGGKGKSDKSKGHEGQKAKVDVKGQNGRGNGNQVNVKSRKTPEKTDEIVIEFSCNIYQQNCDSISELPHILIKMRPKETSASYFKNLYCSFRSMVLGLVFSHLFDG